MSPPTIFDHLAGPGGSFKGFRRKRQMDFPRWFGLPNYTQVPKDTAIVRALYGAPSKLGRYEVYLYLHDCPHCPGWHLGGYRSNSFAAMMQWASAFVDPAIVEGVKR